MWHFVWSESYNSLLINTALTKSTRRQLVYRTDSRGCKWMGLSNSNENVLKICLKLKHSYAIWLLNYLHWKLQNSLANTWNTPFAFVTEIINYHGSNCARNQVTKRYPTKRWVCAQMSFRYQLEGESTQHWQLNKMATLFQTAFLEYIFLKIISFGSYFTKVCCFYDPVDNKSTLVLSLLVWFPSGDNPNTWNSDNPNYLHARNAQSQWLN